MKSKKAYTHPFTELHFVSTLPLKRSIQLISNVAYPHPMLLTQINPDTVKFDIQYENGTIEGTLQRWQGDETRINCAGGVSRVLEARHSDGFAANLIVVWLMISLALMCSEHMALGFIAMIFLLVTASWLQNRDPEIIPVFRERDAIFQEIIDSFKNNGEVAAI